MDEFASHGWCVTKTGRRATWLHAARTEPIRLAWSDGFQEGQWDAVAAMDSAAPWSEGYLAMIRTQGGDDQ